MQSLKYLLTATRFSESLLLERVKSFELSISELMRGV